MEDATAEYSLQKWKEVHRCPCQDKIFWVECRAGARCLLSFVSSHAAVSPRDTSMSHEDTCVCVCVCIIQGLISAILMKSLKLVSGNSSLKGRPEAFSVLSLE